MYERLGPPLDDLAGQSDQVEGSPGHEKPASTHEASLEQEMSGDIPVPPIEGTVVFPDPKWWPEAFRPDPKETREGSLSHIRCLIMAYITWLCRL